MNRQRLDTDGGAHDIYEQLDKSRSMDGDRAHFGLFYHEPQDLGSIVLLDDVLPFLQTSKVTAGSTGKEYAIGPERQHHGQQSIEDDVQLDGLYVAYTLRMVPSEVVIA